MGLKYYSTQKYANIKVSTKYPSVEAFMVHLSEIINTKGK